MKILTQHTMMQLFITAMFVKKAKECLKLKFHSLEKRIREKMNRTNRTHGQKWSKVKTR